MAKATLKLGTISHGTLRSEDVVPELLWTLEHRTDRKGARIARKLRRDFDRLPENDPDGGADEIWSEACSALEAYIPPFCYVGALDGDGSAIGVWTSDDAIQNGVAEGEIWQERDCDCGITTGTYRGVSGDFRLDSPEMRRRMSWNDPRFRGQHAAWCAGRMPKSASYRLVISDHGNMSLYTRSGRPVW